MIDFNRMFVHPLMYAVVILLGRDFYERFPFASLLESYVSKIQNS